MFKIACIASIIEKQRDLTVEQILKQTIQPDKVHFYIDDKPVTGLENRRVRIAENQTKLQAIVERMTDIDLVWQIEGDGILPHNALERLITHYYDHPAIYSGVEVGRHGLYCLGAWHIARDRQSFQSVDYRLHGLQRVDAMGLYCFLMAKEPYLYAKPSWNNHRWGPDVNFFLSSPVDKYVDMDLHVGHQIRGGIIMPTDASTCNARFWKENKEWRFEQL